MKAGDTFVLPDWTGQHLHIILAILPDGCLVLCHFTTRRSYSDSTCIIKAQEHSFIGAETAVRYDQAYICCGDGLDALERIIVKHYEPLKADILERVRKGAFDSPQTPDKIKAALAKALK